ncbi:hypothetical protein RHMOL_Rhmol09G0141800 [Rhododendron molle]|uniref:Uncharacterized protein n=1 Tax=Rhododendron molle TaxID=49168 RepID=A0ACC0MEL8_RHOML|nr:hypothetical protein RHMOL_Rhmol09G0141800 [Rhododendron molle]
MVVVASIEEKLRKNRLRWFGYVYRRPGDAVVKRADIMGGNATERGKPKLTLDAIVRKDMIIIGLCEQVTLDKTQRRKIIYVADPKWLTHKAWFGYITLVFRPAYAYFDKSRKLNCTVHLRRVQLKSEQNSVRTGLK